MEREKENGKKSDNRGGSTLVPQREKTDGNALSSLVAVWKLSRRPVPTAYGDGTYPELEQRSKFRKDLKSVSLRDIKTLRDLVRNKMQGTGVVDDKTMLMERVIQLVSDMPHRSRLREELTNAFVNELWTSLEHPPLLSVGLDVRYRSADGSLNNPLMPNLGAAGATYARSCRPGTLPLGALPDPGQIFDSIFARHQYRKHPNNVSSILWYWASIIIMIFSGPTPAT
jgi:hypothetical protein